jgi:hypothetical protein
VQKWLGRRQATWASDGSKTITFELPAREDVSVWMTRARPQLVVRCLSRTTEVFVSLGSAASVEQQTGVHTVKIEIDDDPAVVQQWTDSVSSQDLFSPDALTLTRRLADAQRMRFSYTPFNAQPSSPSSRSKGSTSSHRSWPARADGGSMKRPSISPHDPLD